MAARRLKPGARVLPALALAAALAVTGCGGDERPTGSDLTAIKCPLVQDGEEMAGVPRYRPADDSFDTVELIGKPIAEARTTAADHGCRLVVSQEDGKGLPVPIEVDPRAIYVHTAKQVVTDVEGVGGGI